MKRSILLGAVLVMTLACGRYALSEDNPDKMPWRTDIKAAFEEANAKGLPIVVNVTSPWGHG